MPVPRQDPDPEHQPGLGLGPLGPHPRIALLLQLHGRRHRQRHQDALEALKEISQRKKE